MTDRFDDLLIKARAEMLGKHTLRAEPSTDAVFEYVWDGIQKGFWGGAKRGYKAKRRMPGRSGQLSDDQMSIYDQMRGPKPKRTRGPRQPKAPAPPITDESRMLPEQSAQQPITDNSRMLPENTFSGSSTEVPHLPENEPMDLVEGKDWEHINEPGFFENVGAQGPWGGANTAPENRQLPAPSENVGAQSPPSAFEQGWDVSQRRDVTNTADEWGNVEDMPPAPPAEAPPTEESRVGLPWQPTLTESGPGSRLEDWNTRSRKIWGDRSGKGRAMAEYYASLEAPPEAEAPAPAPEAEAPAPNAPTDVESATQRAQERQTKRVSTPQSDETLFDAPAPSEPKLEDLPGNPNVQPKPASSGEAVPYGEYTKHIQAAMQGNEQSLNWLASNPASVAQHSSDGLPQRIQDAITAMSGSSEAESPKKPKKGKKAEDKTPPMPKKPKKDKKKSHDAFNSAWSVLKDPFANPFDNPSAFAIHDNFNINKARRLPSETEMNSIRGVGEALSVSPDPPTMNAGMPRMKDMDAYYAEQQAARDETDRYFKNQEKLSAMGMDEIQARLAANPEHEGDWRHLSQEGLDRASMAEIAQLMADIDHESMHEAQPVEKQYQNADMSLLPAGVLKQLKGQRQADADFSLLPSGWQEGVVE